MTPEDIRNRLDFIFTFPREHQLEPLIDLVREFLIYCAEYSSDKNIAFCAAEILKK